MFCYKRGGLCTAHAYYVKTDLAEKGVVSNIIVKENPEKTIDHFEHTLLAIQGEGYTLIVDPFQIPDYLCLSTQGEKVDYGPLFKGFQRTAILQENGSIITNEKHPKTGKLYQAIIRSDSIAENPHETVTKTNMFIAPKFPLVLEKIINKDAVSPFWERLRTVLEKETKEQLYQHIRRQCAGI